MCIIEAKFETWMCNVHISVQSTLLSYCPRNVLGVVSTPHSQVEYEEEELQAREVEHDVVTEVTVPQVKTLFQYQGQGMGFEKGEVSPVIWHNHAVLDLCLLSVAALLYCFQNQ